MPKLLATERSVAFGKACSGRGEVKETPTHALEHHMPWRVNSIIIQIDDGGCFATISTHPV